MGQPMSTLSTEYRPVVLPPGKCYRDLTPDQRLRIIYGYLDRLRQANGGYVSAPCPPDPETGTPGYDVIELRDMLLASTANEYLGEAERLLGTYALGLQLLEKFHHRIIDTIVDWPAQEDYSTSLLPNRYHPRSLAEMIDGANGHQTYVLGLLLYKLGDLMKHGFNLVVRPAEIHLVKDLVQYIHNCRWAQDVEQGFWCGELSVHSSSLGAVVGGLTMWQTNGYYDYRYPVSRDISRLVPIPNRLVEEGREALLQLLPNETPTRGRDLAQLSLIWPFNVLRDDPELQDAILAQVEGLVGERGVKRYDGDPLGMTDEGQEAEWPMGFAWLAIVLAKMVYRDIELGRDRKHLEGLLERAMAYMSRLDKLVEPDGGIPEYYSGATPSDAVPYAMAHGMYVAASVSIRQSRTEIRQKLV